MTLQELIDRRMGTWLADRGVSIHRGTPVRRIDGDGDAVAGLLLADGTRRAFDAVIAAVPWGAADSLFDDTLRAGWPAMSALDGIQPGAITAVHLWFDGPLCPLPMPCWWIGSVNGSSPTRRTGTSPTAMCAAMFTGIITRWSSAPRTHWRTATRSGFSTASAAIWTKSGRRRGGCGCCTIG